MRAGMVVVYAAAGVLAALYAVLSWRRRKLTSLAVSLAVIMTGAAEWSFAQAFAVAAPTPGQALAFNYLIFPGVATVVAGYYWHATVFAGNSGLQGRKRLLLLIHPVLLLTVVATDPWHHAFYRLVSVTADHGIVPHPGPAYWIHTAYSYLLLAFGTALVVRAMRQAVRGQRRVFVIFLASGSAPVTGNLVTLFADVDAQRFDLTPLLFMVTGILWWWAERSGIAKERVPVAYGQVIAALTDAVMVLDPTGRFLDLNPAAVLLLAELQPTSAGKVLGQRWQDVVGPELTSTFAQASQSTYTLPSGTVYDVRIVRMRAADGSNSGTVVVVRDVTELERLRAELTDQAVRDGLTGMYNRRHLTAVLAAEVPKADGEQPLSIVMIDVDHFKSVNDRYGHAVGDEVLIRIARHLMESVRDTDTVARYGGEEFVVVLPGTDAGSAALRADDWRRACAELAIDTPDGPLAVTFSAGVAQVLDAGRPEDLLRRADEALYQAKGDGRDRVLIAGHLSLEAAEPAWQP